MPNETRRLVLGITGPVGSGVTSVSKALESRGGFFRYSLAAAIKADVREANKIPADTPLTEASLPGFRSKLQDQGNEGRKQSPEFWVKRAIDQPGEFPTGDVVIDGIRNLREAWYLREQYHGSFFLIAVNAKFSTRWNRVKEAYGGRQLQFELDDFRDAEEEEEEGQQVALCVGAADYVFVNDKDAGSSGAREAQLFERLSDDLELMRGGRNRPPHQAETQMATAYAQSHMSQCLKRHVGAVIVGREHLPLSIGFNENPVNMKPCLNEFRHCFKDEAMHKKLEEMRDFYCPKCGQQISRLSEPWKCKSCGENLKRRLFPSRNMELCTAIHAEERAIRSLGTRSAEDGTLYTTTFPCFQCSRYVVDAGIKRVVYVEPYPVKEAEDFLMRNGVTVEPFAGFKAKAFFNIFQKE